jgi:hypothetical protein
VELLANVADFVTEAAYASFVKETVPNIETVAKSRKRNVFLFTKLFDLFRFIKK